jgi:hypothetical protein
LSGLIRRVAWAQRRRQDFLGREGSFAPVVQRLPLHSISPSTIYHPLSTVHTYYLGMEYVQYVQPSLYVCMDYVACVCVWVCVCVCVCMHICKTATFYWLVCSRYLTTAPWLQLQLLLLTRPACLGSRPEVPRCSTYLSYCTCPCW